jgi:uncharacterized Zn finger protein
MSNDNYGFCYGIEKNAVKVFNKAGLKVFAEIADEEWTKELAKVQVQEKGDKKTPGSFRLRWLWNVLRAIYLEQRDAERYLAVAKKMGLTPRDCEALAEINEKRRKPEEALTWVDRGLQLEKEGRWPNDSSWGLPDKKRKLLKQLGRGEDALASAWNEFQEHPSKYSYQTLIKYVPRGQQSEWHAKVLKVAEAADLDDAIELYVETKEWERLAQLVREAKPAALEDLSHYTTEPAAKKLEKMDPEAAGKLYCALGLRILNSKKSKYYGAALDNFDRAKKCFQKAGLEKQWDALVGQVRSEHSRKSGFIPSFEALLTRGSLPRQQSFLERARKRRAHHFRTT